MSAAPIAPQAAAVLAEFANQLEVPEVAFDEGGNARFQVNGQLELLFAADTAGLTLSADLGPLPPGETLACRALEASYWRRDAAESWLGLAPDTRHLHLFRRLPAEGLAYPEFEERLRQLLEDAATWLAVLNAAPRAAADHADAGVAGLPPHFDRA